MKRRRCASRTAARKANGLVAELCMLVSIVMAMFSNPESGSLACHPFYRGPAASMVSACAAWWTRAHSLDPVALPTL
jgi:hypothetical protein